MIDLHCHILPGVDDGSPDLETSLVMAQMAVASGVTEIVATPHCNLPYSDGDYRNYATEALRSRFRDFQEELNEREIPLKIRMGAEVFLSPEVPELFENGDILTINHSDYVLTEFEFDEPLEYMDDLLHAMLDVGARPILAHPERYEAVQQIPAVIGRWFQEGILIQLNKGSVLGRFGDAPQETAFSILEAGQAHLVASDAHNIDSRTTHMREITEFLQDNFSPEYTDILLNRNPRRILENRNPVDI